MLCPEVWNFEVPNSMFQITKIDEKSLLPNDHINNFYYNHLVSVTIPDSFSFPDSLKEKLILDCDYYKIYDLNLSDLLNIIFLKYFVKSGHLTLISVNTRIDCDNCICVTPYGELIVNINKQTFQSLGLEGKVSHFTEKNKSKYVIKINLKDLEPGKTNYEKIKSCLQTLDKFTVIVLWEPSEEDICPSSVAKYFSDLGYKVKVCCPNFTSNTICSVRIPEIPFTGDLDNIVDFVEWLGMISINGDLEANDPGNYQTSFIIPEPNKEFGQVKFLQWRGLFSRLKIKELISNLTEYITLENKPWISVYVQGFSDSPVAWNSDEHHYYINGDSGYLSILNSERCIFCCAKCSIRQYK